MRTKKYKHDDVTVEGVLDTDQMSDYSDASDFDDIRHSHSASRHHDSESSSHFALSSYQAPTKTLAAQQLDEKLKGKTKSSQKFCCGR